MADNSLSPTGDPARSMSGPPRWTNDHIPATISSHDSANAIFHTPRKLICGSWRNTCNMLTDFSQPFITIQSKTSRVTNTPENRFASKPMVSVTPKPLTEPLPIQIKIAAVRIAVRCASKITRKARVYAAAIAARNGLFAASSSRTRS